MKLTTKFTLWYFGIMLVVLLIGGAIVYYEIQWKISRVEALWPSPLPSHPWRDTSL